MEEGVGAGRAAIQQLAHPQRHEVSFPQVGWTVRKAPESCRNATCEDCPVGKENTAAGDWELCPGGGHQ